MGEAKRNNKVLNLAIVLLTIVLILIVAGISYKLYVSQAVARDNDPETPARIKQSIRATFPTFCVGPTDELILRRTAGWLIGDNWTVSCSNPYPYPWHEPFVSVNVIECSVRAALDASPEWHQGYSGVFASSIRGDVGKLAVCP